MTRGSTYLVKYGDDGNRLRARIYDLEMECIARKHPSLFQNYMRIQSITKTAHHGEDTFAYDIYIGDHPPSTVNGRNFYNGDIYVCLTRGDVNNEISIYDKSGWRVWSPRLMMKICISGFMAYPAACNNQGLLYASSTIEWRTISAGALYTMAALSRIIAKDAGIALDTVGRSLTILGKRPLVELEVAVCYDFLPYLLHSNCNTAKGFTLRVYEGTLPVEQCWLRT